MHLKLRLFALTLVICACFALCPAQENSVIELSNADILPMVRAKLPTDAHVINESNYFIKAKDATYEGLYTYPADAINSSCGKVRLEICSERNPETANTKTLSEKTVVRVENDFAPYFQKYGRSARP